MNYTRIHSEIKLILIYSFEKKHLELVYKTVLQK